MNTQQTEIAARLAGLMDGPWFERGQLAWREIASPHVSPSFASGNRDAQFPRLAKDKQQKLATLLRPHWVKAIKASETPIRDSFDEALSLYNLYELAIETGYIGADDVAEEIRNDFNRLFASRDARDYLGYYDYIGVAMLAQRTGVDVGWPRLNLPETSRASQSRFATFLSQHRLWYDNGLLEDWLAFLDDYYILEGVSRSNKDAFWDFLNAGNQPSPRSVHWGLVLGADKFLILLTDLYNALPANERPYYGLFYSYWMARFFGFDRDKSGLFRDDDQTDWGETIVTSKRLRALAERMERDPDPASTKGPRLSLDYLKSLESRVDTVRNFWRVTMQYSNSISRAAG